MTVSPNGYLWCRPKLRWTCSRLCGGSWSGGNGTWSRRRDDVRCYTFVCARTCVCVRQRSRGRLRGKGVSLSGCGRTRETSVPFQSHSVRLWRGTSKSESFQNLTFILVFRSVLPFTLGSFQWTLERWDVHLTLEKYRVLHH